MNRAFKLLHVKSHDTDMHHNNAPLCAHEWVVLSTMVALLYITYELYTGVENIHVFRTFMLTGENKIKHIYASLDI